jgi:hypothetical protein
MGSREILTLMFNFWKQFAVRYKIFKVGRPSNDSGDGIPLSDNRASAFLAAPWMSIIRESCEAFGEDSC